jgi:hypothetical protein
MGRRPILRAVLVLLVFGVSASACTGPVPSAAPSVGVSTPAPVRSGSPRKVFDPRIARVVGSIRAPLPAGDDITLFRPIILAAYAKICSDTLDVDSEIRHEGSRTFVVVRCDIERSRAVRVIYTGVTVPKLVGSLAGQAPTLMAMLRLELASADRRARSRYDPGTIVRQEPLPGTVVPFGTVVRVVVAAERA